MYRKTFLPLLVCILFLGSSLIPTKGNQIENEDQNDVEITLLSVHILHVNEKQGYANVIVEVTLTNYPFDATSVNVTVGFEDINCTNDDFGIYQGSSKVIPWTLERVLGHYYPSDLYSMNFTIKQIPHNLNFTIESFQAEFSGVEFHALRNTWIINKDNHTKGLIVYLNRNIVLPVYQMLLPIILCYFVLQSTLFVDPRKRSTIRVTIYISLIVFIPVFLFTIQDALPLRFFLSIPEFLLVNLLIDVTLYTLCTVLSIAHTRVKYPELFFDAWAIVWSIIIFCFFSGQFYTFTPFQWAGLLSFLFILYGLGIIGLVSRYLNSRKETKRKDVSYIY